MMKQKKIAAAIALAVSVASGYAFASSAPIENAQWEHAPYAERVCNICHQNDNPANPGPIVAPVNDICAQCHDGFAGKHQHAAVQDKCTNCHNPHNGDRELFLSQATPALCTSCHTDIAKAMAGKSQHSAVDAGRNCMNCHNPHASKIEKLLKALPYDLCVNCHSTNDMFDDKGKRLTNIKQLLETRAHHHGPVAEKDCGSCHTPHGGEHFRLLVNDYPAKFYSPYDPDNYRLCFTCHDSAMIDQKETAAITGFRDKKRNLHYLHVNKDTMGRTCRACHEVHAAENPHIVRDSVPYGNSGWMLKINFQKLPDGGRCSKTCHTTKEYHR